MIVLRRAAACSNKAYDKQTFSASGDSILRFQMAPSLHEQIASRIALAREAGRRITTASMDAHYLEQIRWQWPTGWIRINPVSVRGEGMASLEMRCGCLASVDVRLDLAVAEDLPQVRLEMRIGGGRTHVSLSPGGTINDEESAAVLAAFTNEAIPALADRLSMPQPLVRYFIAKARDQIKITKCGRGERHLIEVAGNLAGNPVTIYILYDRVRGRSSRIRLVDGAAIAQKRDLWIRTNRPAMAPQLVDGGQVW
jgi:hypothetical protein